MGSILARIAMPLLAACTAACGGLITDSLVARYPLSLLLLERGETSASVEGYLAAGVPDPLFGSGGVTVIDGAARGGAPGGFDAVGDMTIDGEGRILLTGMSADSEERRRMSLVRLLPEGGFDDGFGKGGIVTTPLSIGAPAYGASLAEDRRGRIITGGAVAFGDTRVPAVWRHLASGLPDGGFGAGGVALIEGPVAWGETLMSRCADVAIDGEGGIVGAGVFLLRDQTVIALFRMNDDGSLDKGFGDGGFASVEGPRRSDVMELFASGSSLAIDRQGRIILAGTLYAPDDYDIAVWRFTEKGSLDRTFGRGGRLVIDLSTDESEPPSNDLSFALALDEQGAAHVAGLRVRKGELLEMALVRLTREGQRDLSFGRKGFVIIPGGMSEIPFSVALDREGRVILGGVFQHRSGNLDLILWRYLPDGRPDIDFGCEGRIIDDGAARGGALAGDAGLVFHDSVIFGMKIAVTRAGGIIMAGAALNMGRDYDMAVWRYR